MREHCIHCILSNRLSLCPVYTVHGNCIWALIGSKRESLERQNSGRCLCEFGFWVFGAVAEKPSKESHRKRVALKEPLLQNESIETFFKA